MIAGEQYSTVFKDTRELAGVTVEMVDAILSGGEPEINDTKTYDNGVKVVPSYLLEPHLGGRRPTAKRSWSARATTPRTSCSKLIATDARPAPRPVRRRARLMQAGGTSHGHASGNAGDHQDLPGRAALDHVNLHGRGRAKSTRICGENGAGKSTLMKVLSGVYPHGTYEGEILYDGETPASRGIHDSEEQGHHHHPPGTCAGAAAVDRREPVPRATRWRSGGVINWPETFQQDRRRCCAKVGLNEAADGAGGQAGRRQAAADRDRQGAGQGRAPADPRRADRGACRKTTARSCWTCCWS